MTTVLATVLLGAFLVLGVLAWRTRGFLAGLIALIGAVAAAGLIAVAAFTGASRGATTAAAVLLAAFALIGVALLGLARLANRLLGEGDEPDDA